MRVIAAVALLAFGLPHAADAGNILDHVRATGQVQCSAAERPGVAEPRADGGIEGKAVDFCRAVAIAVLGRDGRIMFDLGTSQQAADIAFVAEDNTTAPIVFVDRLAVLVPRASPVHALRDLSGHSVCLMAGSDEHSALEKVVAHLGIDITRLPFQEDDELYDAYAVGHCDAMVGSAIELSNLLGPYGINRLVSRLLPEPLGTVSVVAAASPSDRDWTAIVHWVAGLLAGNDVGTMPPGGVRGDWKQEVGPLLRVLDQAAKH